MNEEQELLKQVAVCLERAGIEFMITGSMAMAVYSTPRMTRDIDIIINVSLKDVDRIVALFQEEFYIDKASVRKAIHDKGMFNIIHNESIIKVDFIIRKNEEYRIGEFNRRQMVELDGIPIQVVAPEDLVLSKLVWAKRSGSELQFRDVQQMMIALKDINHEYLEKWSKTLGVEDLLEKVKKHA